MSFLHQMVPREELKTDLRSLPDVLDRGIGGGPSSKIPFFQIPLDGIRSRDLHIGFEEIEKFPTSGLEPGTKTISVYE